MKQVSNEMNELWQVAQYQRWLTAAHEAGHLVVPYFFGLEQACLGIKLANLKSFYRYYSTTEKKQKKKILGVTISEESFKYQFPPLQSMSGKIGSQLLAYKAIALLSGSYAEAMIESASVESHFVMDWLADTLEDCASTEDLSSRDDFAKIWRIAGLRFRQTKRKMSFIKEMCSWTDNLFCTPGIALATKELTQALVQMKGTWMSYRTARRILMKSTGKQQLGCDQTIWANRFPNLRKALQRYC